MRRPVCLGVWDASTSVQGSCINASATAASLGKTLVLSAATWLV